STSETSTWATPARPERRATRPSGYRRVRPRTASGSQWSGRMAWPKPTPAAAATSAGPVPLMLRLPASYDRSFILPVTESHIHAAQVTPAVPEQVAEAMHALATPSRVLILARLRERPHSVSEL